MTINEWIARDEENNEFVINTMEHKTTGGFGAACVVSHQVVSLMEEYFLHIRQMITPQNAAYERGFFS